MRRNDPDVHALQETQPSLTLHPPPRTWASLAGRDQHDARSATFRRELGLPDDRTVIMSGHQAEFWHLGIVAKLLAAGSAAVTLRDKGIPTVAAWVVVDQDTGEPWRVRVPARGNDGTLRGRELSLPLRSGAGGSSTVSLNTPICAMPVIEAGLPGLTASAWSGFKADESPASAEVKAGLDTAQQSLARHADAPNLAQQITRATFDMLREIDGHAPPFMATSIARTQLFAEWVARMLAEPAECISAYNTAARAFPAAALRPLQEDRAELPLWIMRPGEPRKPAFVGSLAGVPMEHLAPRALLMTALLRAAGCDLFIHGKGGAIYDHATEAWMKAWMPGRPLAPTVLATATVHIKVEGVRAASEAEAARAHWMRHAASHNPSLLHDAVHEEHKRHLLHRIAEAPRKSAQRSTAFFELHALLRNYRQRHAAALMSLEQTAREMHERSRDGDVLFDRTWPFFCHPRAALLTLRSDIARAFEI